MAKKKSKIDPKMSDPELSRFLRAMGDGFGSVKMHLLLVAGEAGKGNRDLAVKVIRDEAKHIRYFLEVMERVIKDG